MVKPSFDHSKESIVSGIGLTDEVATKISKYFRQRLIDFNAGKIKKLTMIIEMSVDEGIVTNEAEILYMGFIVGLYIEQRHHEEQDEKMIEVFIGSDKVEIIPVGVKKVNKVDKVIN